MTVPSTTRTLGSIPTTTPASMTGMTTPPAQSTVTVATKRGSTAVSQGSPGLQALATVAAQVDRQVGWLPLHPIGTIFRRDSRGVALGQVVGGAGAVQQQIPGVVYTAVPGLAPLMLPDDPTTQRCAAGLAHILGPPVPYVPPPVSATSPSPTPSDQRRLLIATIPSATPAAPAGPLSAPASLPSSVVVTGSTTSAASSAASVGATLGVAAARGRTTSVRGRHDTLYRRPDKDAIEAAMHSTCAVNSLNYEVIRV